MSHLLHKLTGKMKHDSSRDVHETEGEMHREEAPVERTRVHDKYDHVDKTQEEVVHNRTDVKTVVQPIVDKRAERGDTRVVDEGVEVHEHGTPQLDGEANAELHRRHEKLAASGGMSRDEMHVESSERPAGMENERHRLIKQVQPVIERDIDVPHRVEHSKKDVTIIHEPAKFHAAELAPAVTVGEYMKQAGHHHGDSSSSSSSSSSAASH